MMRHSGGGGAAGSLRRTVLRAVDVSSATSATTKTVLQMILFLYVIFSVNDNK